MSSVHVELALTALAAMLSPTTVSFSVLALVLADRPLRSGFWFYVGALGASLAVGVAAAFVLGDAAASSTSDPKTWVAILDIVFGGLVLAYVARAARRPVDPERAASMTARMSDVVSSRAIAVVAAGATLANPGGFIPIALKQISQLDPTAAEYILEWVLFCVVSLLPLAVALVLLLVSPEWAKPKLGRARTWLEGHARQVAAVILVALGVALMRNGIAGLVS